ncbi:MAG: hypothetical protein IPP94_05635 [Ignavibacteria bacterium]|nr:hypothetical protein [Ignavibacteria bacterium]
MKRILLLLLLSLGTLPATPVFAATEQATDYTYEEWLERYGRYLSPMTEQCRDGYLDIFTGVLGKLIVVASRPLSEWTIGRLLPYPGVVPLGALAYQWMGTQIASEGLWLCWCLPYTFEMEYVFNDENGVPEVYVVEKYKATCCTKTSVGVVNYQHSKCKEPSLRVEDCFRREMFGQNYCF